VIQPVVRVLVIPSAYADCHADGKVTFHIAVVDAIGLRVVRERDDMAISLLWMAAADKGASDQLAVRRLGERNDVIAQRFVE